jgi:hypothetical protein
MLKQAICEEFFRFSDYSVDEEITGRSDRLRTTIVSPQDGCRRCPFIIRD